MTARDTLTRQIRKETKVTYEERKAQVKSYLGKTVTVTVDRPIGYVHKKNNYSLTYPVNYGYVSGVIGGDGEELDVYLLGVDVPVTEYTARVIGILHRRDDVEDKLVAAPEGVRLTALEIEKAVRFQEKYYRTDVEALFEKSCGTVPYTYVNGRPRYLMIRSLFNGDVGFPKGHVEKGETETDTAVRETWEETSVTVALTSSFRHETSYTMPNGKIKTVVYFLGRFDEQTPRRNGNFEDNEYLILPFEEAHAALTHANAKELLRLANESLTESVSDI